MVLHQGFILKVFVLWAAFTGSSVIELAEVSQYLLDTKARILLAFTMAAFKLAGTQGFGVPS